MPPHNILQRSGKDLTIAIASYRQGSGVDRAGTNLCMCTSQTMVAS